MTSARTVQHGTRHIEFLTTLHKRSFENRSCSELTRLDSLKVTGRQRNVWLTRKIFGVQIHRSDPAYPTLGVSWPSGRHCSNMNGLYRRKAIPNRLMLSRRQRDERLRIKLKASRLLSAAPSQSDGCRLIAVSAPHTEDFFPAHPSALAWMTYDSWSKTGSTCLKLVHVYLRRCDRSIRRGC